MNGPGSVSWFLLCLALSSCSDALTPLRLESVSPTRAAEGLLVDLELAGEGIRAAVVTDFRSTKGSSLDATVSAALVAADGTEVLLEEVVFVDAALVRAHVPATTPRGLYDVRLTDARGETATLPGAFSVVAPADAVARFEFQPVGPQHARVPFPLRVLAVDEAGALVESFEGTLELTDDTGTVTPLTVGPFVRGRLQAFVSIGVLTTGTVLHGRNAVGRMGDSESFAVSPGPATAMVFASAPAAGDAGGCVGPFALRLEDTWGFVTPATADVAVALSAIPALGAEFFADAACSTAAATLTVSAGDASTQVYVKATVAGPLTVRAAPDTLPSVQASVMVRPLAPVALTFATAPSSVRVGECSAAFDVRAEDSLGNASAPPGALVLMIAATPAAGVAFFDDATCTTAVNAPQLDVGRAEVRFFVSSSIAATVRLDVSGAGLSAAAADVEVTP